MNSRSFKQFETMFFVDMFNKRASLFVSLQSQTTTESMNLNSITSSPSSLNDQIQIPTDYGTKGSKFILVNLI